MKTILNIKNRIPDQWKYLSKKLAYPYEFCNSIDDYQKRVTDYKKEDFFSKFKKNVFKMKKLHEQWISLKNSISKTDKN